MKQMMTLTLGAVASLTLPGTAHADQVVIHAGTLIDGVSKAERHRISIVIRDDRIVSVDDGYLAPAGAAIIDLSNQTVLPGLIDCHDHLTVTSHPGDPIMLQVTRTDFDDAIEAVVSARQTLLAGFTSVRDVGGSTSIVVALKHAVDAGVVPGPRMWVSGDLLGPTGGGSDLANGLDPELEHPHWPERVIDGPDEARRAVRRLKREGVDLIKILPSGAVASVGDDPSLQLMQDDEIKSVVDTAHALKMKVAAHAHGKQAIDHAILLGVDSIEHGSYGDAGSYALFKSHGTYLVPTLLVAEKVYQRAKLHPEDLVPSAAAKALTVAPLMKRNLHDAYRAGVKIAFGTDTFGLSKHGENGQEFALLIEAGMTPIDAIMAATHNAADLIGAGNDIGAVSPGHYADLVAVDGDPLKDVRLLEHISFVMKGGRAVKVDGHPL